MFRVSVKLLLASVILLGAGLFFANNKVGAIDYHNIEPYHCQNWAPENGPAFYWGVGTGDLAHGMSGLRVYTYNAKNGKPIDVGYELSSDLPPGNYGTPPGAGPNFNHDARIFKWPLGDENSPGSGRDNRHWFRTGSDRLYFAGGNDYDLCPGWSVLGPGDIAQCDPSVSKSVCPYGVLSQRGNRWVLDCQEYDKDSKQLKAVEFWISDINTPGGADGKYGGHWTIQIIQRSNVIYPNSGGHTKSIHGRFTTTNGETTRINLAWHPNPKPDEGAEAAECRRVDVTTGSEQRAYVNVKDWRGNALVHGPDGPDDWVVIGQKQTRTWDLSQNPLRPKAKGVTVKIVKRSKDSQGNFTVVDVNVEHNYTCYDAVCDLNVKGNVSGWPNGVESQTIFRINSHIWNRGSPPESIKLYGEIDGRPLILANTSGPIGFWYAPGQVERHANDSNGWDVFEPGGAINNYGVGAALYYDFNSESGIQDDGAGPGIDDLVIAHCAPTSYSVFKEFDLTPLADIQFAPNGDNEDPSDVRFVGTGNGTVPDYPGGIDVGYSSTEQSTPYGSGTSTVSHSGTGHTTVVHNHGSSPISPTNAGDRYDMRFCVNQAHGWIGPGNVFSDDTYGKCAETNARIYNKPYLRTYGADVMAGDVCGGGANNIRAYVSQRPGKTGSGGQLGVFALGSIDQFISASLRYSLAHPKPNKGLTFANTGATPFGGDFGAGVCPSDYFAARDNTAPTLASSGNLATVRNQSGKFNANGPITLSNGGLQSRQKAIYVEGDVYISQNITYANSSNYGSVEDIPRFTLIASGNIYISPGVTTLDGTYAAGGKISTCATASGSYSTAQLWNFCRGNRLTINGSFIAPEVEFLRSRGSLRDSRTNDDTATRNNAAEIFIYSPELYLAQLLGESAAAGGSQIYQPRAYDAITTLPPIL